MKVIRADVMGMCAGVRRAIRIADEVEAPRDTTILGELVHNKHVTDGLRRKGFHWTSSGDRSAIPPTRAVLITAHGISGQTRQQLGNAGRELVDATCPFVQGIHDTVRTMADEGRFVIVIGKRSHVEVQGIVGDLRRYAVLAGPDEVAVYADERLGIVCQSTMSAAVAEHTVRRVRALNPERDIRYIQTICRATHDRQAAVLSLLGRVDALVVVGGRHSNNTLELVNLARLRKVPCFHIEHADDIQPAWFREIGVVGLTAGASTPDDVIDAVHGRLASLADEAVGTSPRGVEAVYHGTL